MGKIIKLNKKLLKPIDPSLNQEKLKSFLIDFLNKPKTIIIPVRNNPYKKGKIILDGHSRSTILDLLSQIKYTPLYGWLAENKENFIKKCQKEPIKLI